MRKLISLTLQNLSRRRKTQLVAVLFLMLCGALAEMFTLGAVVPFIGLLVNKEALLHAPALNAGLDFVGRALGASSLVAASVIFAVFACLAAALRIVLSWASFKYVFAVGSDLGEEIYRRTLSQPYIFHTKTSTAEIIASIEKVNSLVMGVLTPAMQMVIALTMTLSLLAAMLWVDPVTSLGAGAFFGLLYAGITRWSKWRLNHNGNIVAMNGSKRIKAIQEGLGNIRDVIIDGTHEVYVGNFGSADREQRSAQANIAVISSSPKYVVESAGVVFLIILANALTSTRSAAETLPVLGALGIGAQRLLPYMQAVYNAIATIRGNVAAARDAIDLLALPAQAVTPLDDRLADSNEADLVVRLTDIRYAYNPTQPPTLDRVNVTLRSGDRVGVVGKTGSGKSTLIDLFMALLTPDSGDMRINDIPLGPHNTKSWQKRIAHVPQAIFLNDATIAENIALGIHPDQIDPERLRMAIDLSQLADVIAALPNGLHTRVGERGIQLSGGQRQRIGIARALYKQADVLVLDEATSALDSETESKIMDSIYTLRPNTIILIIAHRLSTLSRCNRILHIKDRKVTEAAPEVAEIKSLNQ